MSGALIGNAVQTPPPQGSPPSNPGVVLLHAAGYAGLRATVPAQLADGQLELVDGYAKGGDGGGGIFAWSASSTKADNNGTVINPTGNTGAGRWLRQLQGVLRTPQMFGAQGDGATDDTAAFNAALADGPTYVPPAHYLAGGIAPPNGAILKGDVGLGYYGDIAQGTPGSLQQLTPVTPTIIAPVGFTGPIINLAGTLDVILDGLFLDGGANTPTCDGISSGSTRATINRVTAVRCINGIGSNGSPADAYTHVATIIDCEFTNNTYGISNLIDSVMIAGAMSSNYVNLNLQSGANANNFVGVRNEFGNTYGVTGFQAIGNQFVAGRFDRNSGAAVNLGTGCQEWNFVGVQFIRNGNTNTYPNNTHIALNGTTSVNFTSCISQTGVNDDGSGVNAPAYVFTFINSNARVITTNCDWTGFVSGFSQGTQPTLYVQRDNNTGGVGDVANSSQPFIAAGRIAQTPYKGGAANIGPGASTTITLTMAAFGTSSTYATTSRTLRITGQNFNSPYNSNSARIDLMFTRSGATSNFVSASAAYGECGGTGVIAYGGSPSHLKLAISAVAADLSSMTLTITNTGSADGSNWGVWAELV
jgi:hypothetical protein